jgi:hypothetical protein
MKEAVSNLRAIRLPETWQRATLPLLVVGLVCLGAAAALGGASDLHYFLLAYLTSYMFCLSISLGALFFVMVQQLVRAGWSVSVRRLAEILSMIIPVWGLLFLPILASLWLSDGLLYDWDNGHSVQEGLITPAKKLYLNVPFFTIRAVLYFAVWSGLAYYFYGMSRQQDEIRDPELTKRRQKWAGPGIMLFSVATSFAAFDWLMSLSPAWFSTIYGVYLFAGCMMSLMATLIVLVFVLQKQGTLVEAVSVEHYHDLGKLMFGFIFFWTYIAFSQYMLYWYANLPEETFWLDIRTSVNTPRSREIGWFWISIVLVVGHFAVPFLGTMSRHVRRAPAVLCGWAVFVLLMHWVDLYWQVMPTYWALVPDATKSAMPTLTDLLCLIGMVSLYLGALLRIAAPAPLVAIGDPRLPESLAFHNI